ncbi:MAG: PEGA domain-containing protein, partial [Acidobacteria bacterium]|nr:PEGA domain-containing protein [Acidobacteriota bacterium]
TTNPPGAGILVDGRAWPRSTPAQLTLAPGTYNITVERNGQRVTEQVVIRDGMTSYLKIPLGR